MEKVKLSLAAARVNAEMTQAEVAKTLRVSPNTLVAWEKGKRIPNFRTLHVLSDLYEVPMDLFFLPCEST